jgi:rod shape-determining protein MreC
MGALAIWLFKYRFFLLFLLLQSLGTWMTLSNSSYHQSRFTQFQIETSGAYQTRIHDLVQYLNLKEENQILNAEIAALKLKFYGTMPTQPRTKLMDSTVKSSLWPDSGIQIDFARAARVLYQGTGQQQNYIVLNVGAVDGIKPRMAVVRGDIVVGQVQAVSPHFARVIPLIHNKMRTSALHTRSQTTASLVWNGTSPRYAELQDFPIHIPIQIGDSLVSSPYSSVYPAGLRLGRVDKIETVPGAITYKIRVLLAADYFRLDHVQVVRTALQEERNRILPSGVLKP